jgi:hypothetical protein
MIKNIVHFFILPLRALIMVIATLPTPHACGGSVTGAACPAAIHHRVFHAGLAHPGRGWRGAALTWRLAHNEPSEGSQPIR